MTNCEIIHMARQADDISAAKVDWDYEWVVCFAKLVAAKEREACATVADRYADIFGTVDDDMAKAIASDIRARGEA